MACAVYAACPSELQRFPGRISSQQLSLLKKETIWLQSPSPDKQGTGGCGGNALFWLAVLRDACVSCGGSVDLWDWTACALAKCLSEVPRPNFSKVIWLPITWCLTFFIIGISFVIGLKIFRLEEAKLFNKCLTTQHSYCSWYEFKMM